MSSVSVICAKETDVKPQTGCTSSDRAEARDERLPPGRQPAGRSSRRLLIDDESDACSSACGRPSGLTVRQLRVEGARHASAS